MIPEDAYRSRKGLFTLGMGSSGLLSSFEIDEKTARLVRSLGGVLWDREGYSEHHIEKWRPFKEKKFVALRGLRLFVPPATSASQKAGFKPHYEDK